MCEIERGGVRDFHAYALIMAMNGVHQHQEPGNQEDGDPGAIDEFRDQHHEHRDSRNQPAEAVNKHVAPGVRAAHPFPMKHHANLRQGESQKSSHGIQGNQAVGYAAEYDEQYAGQRG